MISSWKSAEQAHQEGQARRQSTPVRALTAFRPHAERRDPVQLLTVGDNDRVNSLIPLRWSRMASSPFSFLRGSAAIMAYDLAGGVDTGIHGHICGDAHAANFGLYASPERRLVFDLNDFDETGVGPWDWDLKRLVASLVCAGREAGVEEAGCRLAARDCAGAYRAAMDELAAMPFVEAHYLTTDHSNLAHYDIDDLLETFDRVRKRAKKNTSRRLVKKTTRGLPGKDWRFVDDPPRLTHVPPVEHDHVLAALPDYRATLDEEIQALVGRYMVSDVAHRIVGLGSIGYRSYIVLFHGNEDDALILQIKQAKPSVLSPYIPQPPSDHQGQRIVRGQRWMQTVSDILLGWTTIDKRHYFVRQFRDMKGSIDPTTLPSGQLDDYARILGVVLARAHSQSMDPRILSGYCGTGRLADEFDAAFSEFASNYADLVESDHTALVAAISQHHHR